MSHTISHTSAVRPRSHVGSRGTPAQKPAAKPAEKSPSRDSVHVSHEAREKKAPRAGTKDQVSQMKKNLCDFSKDTHESYTRRAARVEQEIERLRKSGKKFDELDIYKKHCVTPPF